MKIPRPLTQGSRIAITAFSSGVEASLHPRLDRVLSDLRLRGFEVIEGACLRENNRHVSAPAQQRADELMAFLLDDTIDAIAPPWGGELAMELLPLLDYERISQARPKWVFGFSDVSTLTAVLAARCGWATVHCSNLMDLSLSQTEPLTARTLDRLALSHGDSFTQQASSSSCRWPDWRLKPDAVYDQAEPSCWRNLNNPHQAVRFSGRLIGGCLDIQQHLFDSRYLDQNTLCERFGRDGMILFLENCELSPTDLARALLSLRLRGVFDQINGLLLGRDSAEQALADSAAPDTDADADAVPDSGALTHGEAVRQILGDVPFPVLTDVDFGHVPPNMVLINGALAEVELEPGKPGVIRQTLS